MVYLRFLADGKARYGLLGGKVISEITPDYFSDFRKWRILRSNFSP